ncbi:MAG: hypothetical protein ACYDH6_21160 [Acidimicrobiales bacterium]
MAAMGGDRAMQVWALFSLSLASLSVADQQTIVDALRADFAGFVPLPIETALEVLARSPDTLHERLVSRVVFRVAQAHGPAPFASAAASGVLDQFLLATGLGTQAAFFSAAQSGTIPLSGTVQSGGATWEDPTCVCAPIVVDGVTAQQVTLSFHTSRTVAEMAPYADPRRWPLCSSFWKAMTPVSFAGSTTTSATLDWVATFDEVVQVVPGWPMTTPLAFDYHTPSADEVVSSYYLLHDTIYLDVDEGSITIDVDHANPPVGMPTKIVAIKTIHWKAAGLNLMPHLLCDTIWGELGLNMAERCSL